VSRCGVGETEVGVADHAEHVRDAPVDHRLGHEVGDRVDVRRILDADEHLAVTDLERVRRRLVVEAGRGARERAVVIAVPRAAQQAVLDRALAERAALVRAVVVQRGELPVVVDERDALVPGSDGGDPAFRELVGGEDAMPVHRASFRVVKKSTAAAGTASSSRYGSSAPRNPRAFHRSPDTSAHGPT
jgi:hypothetical protein